MLQMVLHSLEGQVVGIEQKNSFARFSKSKRYYTTRYNLIKLKMIKLTCIE